jgi:hypothetical protein
LKVNKYLLIGLVIAVVFVLYALFFTGGKKKINSVAGPPDPPRVTAPPGEVRSKGGHVQAIRETVRWDRDPFMLPVFATTEKKVEKERAPLKLLAIMESGKGKVAIIDHEVVEKGDVVAGERVVEIGKETVTLIQDGSKRVITMQEPRK